MNSESRAYFNELVSYEEIANSTVDAHIDATCDVGPSYVEKMKKKNNFYCVLHGSNKNRLSMWPEAYERSCFLSPMWPESQCNFLATNLPKLKKGLKTKSNGLDICVHGSHNHIAVGMFLGIPFKKYNATLHFFSRHSLQNIVEVLTLQSVPFLAEKELDYEKYHHNVAQCDTMMVLYEPSFNAEYFPWGDKSSSGSTSSIQPPLDNAFPVL